jgi:hypothetical protein
VLESPPEAGVGDSERRVLELGETVLDSGARSGLGVADALERVDDEVPEAALVEA